VENINSGAFKAGRVLCFRVRIEDRFSRDRQLINYSALIDSIQFVVNYVLIAFVFLVSHPYLNSEGAV
jgi:hypothetical protein